MRAIFALSIALAICTVLRLLYIYYQPADEEPSTFTHVKPEERPYIFDLDGTARVTLGTYLSDEVNVKIDFR